MVIINQKERQVSLKNLQYLQNQVVRLRLCVLAILICALENVKIGKMKLNTNISIENVITVIVLIASMTLAFGFMKADVSSIKKELELKLDNREYEADRNLLVYKIDVLLEDIAEIKQILKERQ